MFLLLGVLMLLHLCGCLYTLAELLYDYTLPKIGNCSRQRYKDVLATATHLHVPSPYIPTPAPHVVTISGMCFFVSLTFSIWVFEV